MKRIHIEWGKINKIAGIIIGILLAIGIVVILYKKKQFMNGYKFTTGKIIYVNAPIWKGAGDYAVIYKYEIGNKVYSSNNNFKFCDNQTISKMRLLFVGKQFPIAYSTKDISISNMILTLKDAERFKYKMPDSLLIFDSIIECK